MINICLINFYPGARRKFILLQLIIKNLKIIENNKSLKTQKQNLAEGKYFSIPTKNDFEQIVSLGMEIISINDYREILANFVMINLSESEKRHLTTFIKHNWEVSN